jgi:hypothetical protein
MADTTPEYYEASKTRIASACGDDLGNIWDNVKAALVVAELNAIDRYDGGTVLVTDPEYEEVADDVIATKLLIGRVLGKATLKFYFQTGILCYYTGGHCITTGGASPYTHTMTLNTTNITSTPPPIAFHLEKETTTGGSHRRIDCMGFANQSLIIEVGEKMGLRIAKQLFTSNFSYTNVAGADLATPTAFVLATHPPYTWAHLQKGGITFQLNSVDVAVNILYVRIEINWGGYEFSNFDSTFYPRTGLNQPPLNYKVVLGVRPYDHATHVDLFYIKNETLSGAAYSDGDLDLTLNFELTNAAHEITFAFDKMFLDPKFEEMYQKENSWFDGYEITLTPISALSSLTITEINELTEAYYENTA